MRKLYCPCCARPAKEIQVVGHELIVKLARCRHLHHINLFSRMFGRLI